MAKWFRRSAPAACLTAAGVLLLAIPATAAPAPPTSVDSQLFLYHQGGQGPAEPGGTAAFVMTTSAYPENPPQHRTAVLELPEGLTFKEAVSEHAAGPCVPDAAGTKVTCTTQDPVDQPPASNGSWVVTVDLADDVPLGAYVTAKATLTTEIPDPNPDNNVSTWDLFVTTGGDMSVSISAPKGPWQVGASFDAKISVHNYGPYASPADLVSAVFPLSLKYTGWPDGCGADPGAMYCTIPVLKAGETYEFTVHFTVSEYDEDPIRVAPTVHPVAPDTDTSNNTATYEADIIKPSTSPSPSPTPTDGSGGGGGEPGLPVTGAPAAALALTGLGLLVAGAGALFLSRRRRVIR